MAWAPASEPGDSDPLISDAKRKLGAYSYGKGLGDTDEYTIEFGVALVEFKTRRNEQIMRGTVRDMPGMQPTGVFDWAVKKNLGILADQVKPAGKKVVFTINGHLGGLFDGVPYFTVRGLELEGRIRVQPVGYDNVKKPFNNASGFRELDRLIKDPTVLPPGTEWAIVSHSQGAVVDCDYYEQVIEPNRNIWPYSHYKGGVRFGNPRRPLNVVAPWVADPPPQGTEGLDPYCLKAATPGVMEVSRDGDLYANKTPGRAGDYKEAIYMAVCRGKFMGSNTLAAELSVLATKFGPAEVFAVFQAIISGVTGLVQLREHNEFDLGPAVDHLRRTLNV